MLTINIPKAELKKAFFGGNASFSQEVASDGKPIENESIVLLKIILENIKPNSKEAA